MINVKKILYIVAIIIAIGSASFFTGLIQQKRANDAYTELENRYLLIEKSNTVLRETNIRLISNNKQLRAEQLESAGLIKSGQDIVREFQRTIGDSYDTLDRIEKGLNTLEQLIGILYPQVE